MTLVQCLSLCLSLCLSVSICLSVCLYSYYRYVLEPELEFTDDAGLVSGPFAQFDGLPLKPLLTVGMDPPESWLVESVHAVYDLDNICMDEVIDAADSL